MKLYLEELCNDIDVLFTHDLEEKDNWKELLIKLLLNHILEFKKINGCDIDLLLEDMKNSIKS